jgi:hypothetical protein
MKNSDKKMALNSEIRNSIGKDWRFCQCYTLSWKSKRRKTNDNEMILSVLKMLKF